jgi:hypothetical protein
MNRALTFTLLALAVVVVLFVASWVIIPAGRYELKNLTTGQWETDKISYPARLFRTGLVQRWDCTPFPHERACPSSAVYRRADLHTVRQRVVIVYGGLAVVVILVGVAFGAARRPGPGVSPGRV